MSKMESFVKRDSLLNQELMRKFKLLKEEEIKEDNLEEFKSDPNRYAYNDRIEYRINGPKGPLHRVGNKPARIWKDKKEYFVGGKRHRTDGPAIEFSNGLEEFWIDGEEVSKEQFNSIQQELQEKEGDLPALFKIDPIAYSKEKYKKHKKDQEKKKGEIPPINIVGKKKEDFLKEEKDEELEYTPCSSCGGPYHPATGHRIGKDTVLCYNCTQDFIKWLKAREASFSRPWKKPDSKTSFLQAAQTSIKAPKEEK